MGGMGGGADLGGREEAALGYRGMGGSLPIGHGGHIAGAQG